MPTQSRAQGLDGIIEHVDFGVEELDGLMWGPGLYSTSVPTPQLSSKLSVM